MTLETYKKANELAAQAEEARNLLRQIRYVKNENGMTFGNYTGEYRVVFTGANKEIITNGIAYLLDGRLKELEKELEEL